MSVASENLGTGYSRLPQTTSDIETSEDEISQHENLIYYRKLATPKTNELTREGTCQLVMADYHPLRHSCGLNENHQVHINGFSNINYNYAHGSTGPNAEDEMMVLSTMGTSGKIEDDSRHSNNHQLLHSHQNPMSAMRRVAFVMSVCLCIFTIVAFLWVLPCNWATCSIIQNDKSGGSSWEKTLLHMELIGGINIVPSENQHHNNILFLVRGEIDPFSSQWPQKSPTLQANTTHINPEKEEESSRIPAGGGGIITLRGSTGAVVWLKTFSKVPRDIDCSLVDLDGSGQNDCVLVGSDDLLCAFNPVTSKFLWYLHDDKKEIFPGNLDFPLILPDLDGDGISELLLTCNLKRLLHEAPGLKPVNIGHKYLVVVSGKTGNIFGLPYAVSNCLHVYDLAMDKTWVLSFTCNDAVGKDSVQTLTLDDLYKSIKNQSMLFILDQTKYPDGGLSLKQHLRTSSLSTLQVNRQGDTFLEGKQSAFSVSGRKLTILNQGHCPQDCSAFAYVSDERAGRNSTIWTDGGENMYVLHPAILSFSDRSQSRSTGALLGPVSGFVLKFWHWIVSSSQSSATTWASNQTRSWLKRTNSSDKYGLFHLSGDESGLSATKPVMHSKIPLSDVENKKIDSKVVKSINDVKDEVFLHRLKERIVLVTFNETNMHLVNASESEILQLCSATECQPSLGFQEQSLMIADLDEDGSKELVSYLTTFSGDLKESTAVASQDGLKLISKVRVVRLEAELPKLYEAVTHTYDKTFDSYTKHHAFTGKQEN